MTSDTDPIVFRGLRGRNLADQAAALEAGYTNMTEYAIDELGRIVLELVARVEALEILTSNDEGSSGLIV